MKAILELPKMPESCRSGCPFYKVCDICDILSSWNNHMPVYTPSERRRDDCPLKPVEDKEKHGKWVLNGNDDDLGITYYCSVCGFGLDEDLFYSGYKDGKWIRNHVFKHCPNCGTKMEE